MRYGKLLAGLAVAVALVGCGEEDDAATTTTDDTVAEDLAAPDGTMAPDDSGPDDYGAGAGDTQTGALTPVEGHPPGFEGVTGQASLTRAPGETSVVLDLEGLPPGQDFLAHVHVAPCAEGAGAHYQFDPVAGGEDANEMHLHFTSESDGTGTMDAVYPREAGPEAVSILTHSVADGEAAIACADLVG
jgi:hypothetical protein